MCGCDRLASALGAASGICLARSGIGLRTGCSVCLGSARSGRLSAAGSSRFGSARCGGLSAAGSSGLSTASGGCVTTVSRRLGAPTGRGCMRATGGGCMRAAGGGLGATTRIRMRRSRRFGWRRRMRPATAATALIFLAPRDVYKRQN